MHPKLSGLASRQTTLQGKHLLAALIDIDTDLIVWVKRVWRFVDTNQLPEQVGHLTIRFFLRFLDCVDGNINGYVGESTACVWIACKVYMEEKMGSIRASEFIKKTKLQCASVDTLIKGEFRIAHALQYEFLQPLSPDFAVALCECIPSPPPLDMVLSLLRDITYSIIFIKVSPLTLAASAVCVIKPKLFECVCELADICKSRVETVANAMIAQIRI